MPVGKTKIQLLVEAKVKEALKDLDKAEKEIDGVAKAGSRASESFKGWTTAAKGLIGALAIKQIASFAASTTKLYEEAQQLRKSLSNLASKEGISVTQLMKDLKTATNGTIDQIKLMQAATQAKFLGIDLKNLPTLFEFAYRRAKDTGQSIDYLVQSIVDGIGRKSPLILDNLGIRLSDLDEKIKNIAIKQGTWNGKIDEGLRQLHLQEAAVQVAKEGIAESGPIVEGATDKFGQLNAKLKDLQIILGAIATGPATNAVLDFFKTLLSFLGVDVDLLLAEGLDKSKLIMERDLKELTDELKKRQEELANLPSFKTGISGGQPYRRSTEPEREAFQRRIQFLQDEIALNRELAGKVQTVIDKEVVRNKNRQEDAENLENYALKLIEIGVKGRDLSYVAEGFKLINEELETNIENLERSSSGIFAYWSYAKNMAQDLQNRFSNALVLQWTRGESAMKNFEAAFKETLANIVAELASKALLWGFFNLITGGAAGYLFGGFKDFLFGGGRQVGGSMDPGKAYVVGEHGPEMVFQGPGKGLVVPLPQIGSPPGIPASPSSYTRIIERNSTVPIMGNIAIETVAPDLARVRKYYININREINIPDTDKFNTFNRTRKGEFDPKN